MTAASPKHRFRRWLLLLVPLALVTWGFMSWRPGSGEGNPPPFQTIAVDRGDVVQSVVATGQLNPVRRVQVGSQISGIIEELLADFNTEVRAGQVVARLDRSTFEAAVRLAEAELASARAAHDLAVVNNERSRSLRGGELIASAEMEASEVAVLQAAASVKIRESQLERARLELERCTIVSPTDGIVISRNVNVGQTVAASLSAPVLFEIAEDLSRMKINARITEADIGRIREGQRADFRVDAYRDRMFSGQVVQIRNAPIHVDNVVTYDTVIHVDNSELLLKPGMTAEVHVITDEQRDVLRLRNTALRARLPDNLRPPTPADAEDQGARVVYRLLQSDERALEAVAVQTGITDGLHTEILEGLSEGDRLATGLTLRTQDDRSRASSLFQGRQAQF
ncbi:MAG: efflux RND transporter periplasmic adaptor subunit [Puniceicoccaceae bacterium]|nr:MAG: efflux RND transporter periplasmic adaptor subunit [Puniceicoccaceae bacterium]